MITWGIVGCGDVTEVKSGPAFNRISDSRLLAVMRRNPALAKDYAERHGVPRWYDDAEELIHDPEVNAVYIATPPSSHAELSIKAMKAGKAVYVEKPMALNYAECQEMVRTSKENNVPLFVAYYRRALPGFLKVKQFIDKGKIGKVRTINLQLYKSLSSEELSQNKPWRVIPAVAGGGHFVDLASHQLDFLDYVFGPIMGTSSLALNQAGAYAAEDIVSANFLFKNDLLATGSWCFTVPEYLQRDSIEIIGEEGSIRFSCFEFTPLELHTKQGIEYFDYPKPMHVQENLIQHIVMDLLGMGKSPSTGKTAARTSRVMELVLKDYYLDQAN